MRLVVIAAAIALAWGAAGAAERVERRLGVMGTWLDIAVVDENRPAALRASEAAAIAIEAAEARLSTWRAGTELSRLNAAPVGAGFPLSRELARDLQLAVRLWRETGGAFDPGIGKLVAARGLRTGGGHPDADETRRVLQGGGLGKLELVNGCAVRRSAGLVLEEGGFGKGVALDDAVNVLRRAGVVSAVLDLGGQLAVVGAAEREVDVADPVERRRPVLRLTVRGGSLATSGNSERPGHLLDPRSGTPAPDFGSVTVWADSAAVADALSTGLYVLGPRGALEYAAAHPDIGVLVLLREGKTVRALVGGALSDAVLTPLVPEIAFDPA